MRSQRTLTTPLLKIKKKIDNCITVIHIRVNLSRNVLLRLFYVFIVKRGYFVLNVMIIADYRTACCVISDICRFLFRPFLRQFSVWFRAVHVNPLYFQR